MRKIRAKNLHPLTTSNVIQGSTFADLDSVDEGPDTAVYPTTFVDNKYKPSPFNHSRDKTRDRTPPKCLRGYFRDRRSCAIHTQTLYLLQN